MRRIVLGMAMSALALSAVSCAEHTSKPVVGAVGEVPAQSFIKQWSLDLGGEGVHVEAVHNVGPYFIVVTKERAAYVIDRVSGKLVTTHTIENRGPILRPSTNGQMIAYPVSTDVELFDLRGKQVKSINLKNAARSSGAFSESTLYVGVDGLNGGRMEAMDWTRTFDTPKWTLMSFGGLPSAPVFMDQTLFFGTDTGRVYAVNETPASVWALDKGYFACGPVIADLAADDYGLYVASTDTKLLALNRANGKVRWQYFAGEPLYAAAVPIGDTVYLPVQSQGLVAINKTEGDFNRKAKWISRDAVQLLCDDARYAYVLLKGNSVAAVDKTSGAVAFRSGGSGFDFFGTNPNKDGLILAASKNGYIAAIKPVTRSGVVGEQMFIGPLK